MHYLSMKLVYQNKVKATLLNFWLKYMINAFFPPYTTLDMLPHFPLWVLCS